MVILLPSAAVPLADHAPERNIVSSQLLLTVPETLTVTSTLVPCARSDPVIVHTLLFFPVLLDVTVHPDVGLTVTLCAASSQAAVPPWIFTFVRAPAVQFWGTAEEFPGRFLRVITLSDKLTIHNAFLDRRFRP